MQPVTGDELYALWEQAKRHELPQRRRTHLPSGGICDDWNIAVRGAANLCAWAVQDGPTPRETRIGIARREKADMEHLCRLLRGDGVEMTAPLERSVNPSTLTADRGSGVLAIDESASEISTQAERDRQERMARDFG